MTDITREEFDKLEKRVNLIEHFNIDRDKAQMQSTYELKELIRIAVQEGTKPILEKFNDLEKRVSSLENAEAKKALKTKEQIWGLIIKGAIAFFVTLFLSNAVTVITDTIRHNKDLENQKIQEAKNGKEENTNNNP